MAPEKVTALCDQLTQECIGITHVCSNHRNTSSSVNMNHEQGMDYMADIAVDYLSHIQKLTLMLTFEIMGEMPTGEGGTDGNPNT